ncbi:SMP-30/gluconolactonase/LRE family protein [Mucilaginibacter mali]|uniref:SMP-30/gluconolactonase/LRE family protein n=1 Tax=Mucilaginibacter mali TaxID=2740462 RepID=A0A7D4Q830_9SPHI|nr:SMP-30/gluconolactonase/LRE family protein [Mucilaginibacter mali]QKJ28564.1 SMP-30/gluconolactonase/LRE family protein [Mucilaginibacter mali]
MKNFIFLGIALAMCMFSCKKNQVADENGNTAAITGGGLKLKDMGIVASNDSAFTISTYAGNGTAAFSNGTSGNLLTASFDSPEGIVFDSGGNMFVADRDNQIIRKITTGGVISTFAGQQGVAGFADGTGTAAKFSTPIRLSIDAANNIYVADRDNAKIRKITSAGVVTTIAGSTAGSGATQFNWPVDVAVKSDGSILYVADSKNHRIQKITLSGGTYTTSLLAGQTTLGYANGTGSAAKFNFPAGVAIDASGNIIVADRMNNCIRKITSGGVVSLLAGIPGTVYDLDAPALQASFGEPYGVTVANDGCIYVCDINYHNVRRISNHGGFVATVAGYSTSGYADGTFNTRFNVPTSVAIDNSGNFYVTDVSNNRIRKMKPETRVIQYTEGWTPMDTSTYAGVKRYRYTGNRFWLPSTASNPIQNINIIDIDMSVNHFEFMHVDSFANQTTVSNIIGHPTSVIAALSGTFATGNHHGKFASYLRNNDVTYWKADAEEALYPDGYWHYHDGMFYVDATGTPGMEQSNMTQLPFSPTTRKYMMSGAPLLIKNSVPIEITSPTNWGVSNTTPPQTLRVIIAPRAIVALPIINKHVLLICIDGVENGIDCYASNGISAPGRYGMTTADATQFVQQFFHPSWAINMDGGGSASMYMMGATDGQTGGVSGGIPVISYPDWDSSCTISGMDYSRYGQQRKSMQDCIAVIAN